MGAKFRALNHKCQRFGVSQGDAFLSAEFL